MLNQFSLLMSVLHSQCCPKRSYFNENKKRSGMQYETENNDIDDANLVERWQPHDNPETVKEYE